MDVNYILGTFRVKKWEMILRVYADLELVFVSWRSMERVKRQKSKQGREESSLHHGACGQQRLKSHTCEVKQASFLDSVWLSQKSYIETV